MKATFLIKVLSQGTVDTKSYRYTAALGNENITVKRLPLDQLDTTAALDGWETVKVLGNRDFWAVKESVWGGNPQYKYFPVAGFQAAARYARRNYTEDIILVHSDDDDVLQEIERSIRE